MFVPVIGQDQQPLMPTTPARARKWIKCGRATPFWKGGIFCVRLNVEPVAREVQPVAVGIDPGSKREGYSVLSAVHTYLNIQAKAREGVKEAEKDSTRMRRSRRKRKTPCRRPRQNRHQSKKKLPPSTRARWHWKLRLARFLCQLFPVSVFVVEDIKARTTGKKRWDQSFSPLEVGKQWFYAELGQLATVQTKQGYETKSLRDQLGLKKTSKKLAEVWEAHCIDAWVLARAAVGGYLPPITNGWCAWLRSSGTAGNCTASSQRKAGRESNTAARSPKGSSVVPWSSIQSGERQPLAARWMANSVYITQKPTSD
jgi:hypothetical protein